MHISHSYTPAHMQMSSGELCSFVLACITFNQFEPDSDYRPNSFTPIVGLLVRQGHGGNKESSQYRNNTLFMLHTTRIRTMSNVKFIDSKPRYFICHESPTTRSHWQGSPFRSQCYNLCAVCGLEVLPSLTTRCPTHPPSQL